MSVQSIAREMLADAIAAGANPEILTGIISPVELAKKGSPRETPLAFTATGFMLQNVVIRDPDTAAHPQAGEVPNAGSASLGFWLYGPDSVSGESAIEQLRVIIYSTFQDVEIELETGAVAFPIWQSGLSTRRNHEEFDGSIVGNEIFTVTYLKGV